MAELTAKTDLAKLVVCEDVSLPGAWSLQHNSLTGHHCMFILPAIIEHLGRQSWLDLHHDISAADSALCDCRSEMPLICSLLCTCFYRKLSSVMQAQVEMADAALWLYGIAFQELQRHLGTECR